MSLTEKQKAFRKQGIGGSDANIIMGGDAERIIRLWKEKRGELEPEDLSRVLPVRMGSFTEDFNITWFEEETGKIVTRQGEQIISAEFPFMLCTLDGETDA
jgi:predicted phage-related endonuclease